TRAVRQVRPLLAARGFAVPGQPGIRLRTLEDVFASAAAPAWSCASTAPRPRSAGQRPSGRGGAHSSLASAEQNTIKTTAISDGPGRTLWAGAIRPGRMHDQTAVKTEGIQNLLRQHPTVRVRVDTGYRGLAKAFPTHVSAPPPPPPPRRGRVAPGYRGRAKAFPPQVTAPPLPPAKDAPPDTISAYQQARRQQSSRRICVEHAIAEHKQWRPLQH